MELDNYSVRLCKTVNGMTDDQKLGRIKKRYSKKKRKLKKRRKKDTFLNTSIRSDVNVKCKLTRMDVFRHNIMSDIFCSGTILNLHKSIEWCALKQVFLTYVKEHICFKCKSPDQLHVDHILPISIFPEFSLCLLNLQLLCSKCNNNKYNNDYTDYRTSNLLGTVYKTGRKKMFPRYSGESDDRYSKRSRILFKDFRHIFKRRDKTTVKYVSRRILRYNELLANPSGCPKVNKRTVVVFKADKKVYKWDIFGRTPIVYGKSSKKVRARLDLVEAFNKQMSIPKVILRKNKRIGIDI